MNTQRVLTPHDWRYRLRDSNGRYKVVKNLLPTILAVRYAGNQFTSHTKRDWVKTVVQALIYIRGSFGIHVFYRNTSNCKLWEYNPKHFGNKKPSTVAVITFLQLDTNWLITKLVKTKESHSDAVIPMCTDCTVVAV